MDVITNNWFFSWLGLWFTVMIMLFFLFVIYRYFKEKFWTRKNPYCVDRVFEWSMIVSFVPWFSSLLLMGFMDFLIMKFTKLAKRGPRIIKFKKVN